MIKNWLPGFMLSTNLFVGALIFALSLAIFLLSPVHQVTDSAYSMLLSENLLHHRSFALGEHYSLPLHEPRAVDNYLANGDIYQLEIIKGHLYYHFPPGSSVLSIPFVAVMNILGVSAANSDGTYSPSGEEKVESIIAALVMGALAVVFFYLALLVLPAEWSALVSLGSVLGTQIWSTASRALWSDTWGTLLLGIVLLMLLAQETGRHNLNPILLATVLAWMYFVRPTYSIHIIAVTVYVFWFYRHLFIAYLVTGALWVTGFVFYSWRIYGRLLPPYYQPARLHFAVVLPGLAGTLFSPARGLLVYVPALFFVGYLLVRYRRELRFPRLVLMAAFVIVCHVVITSASLHWYGGYSFGPRFTTGLAPWFALLAVLGIRGMLAHRMSLGSADKRSFRVELMTGGVLLLLSIAINGLGAADRATWFWNKRPDVDQHPERLWDWRQPQFLAGLIRPPRPKEIAPLPAGRIEFAKPEADRYLWYGWSSAEPGFRWTDGKEAALVFGLDQVRDVQLTIKYVPFLVANRHPRQRVLVYLNGASVDSFDAEEDSERERTVRLPVNLLRRENSLRFDLPDAASPASFGTGDDDRELGIAVRWMDF